MMEPRYSPLFLGFTNNMKGSFIAKYEKMQKPVKATLWFTICNFLVKGISFIAVPVFAFLMTADEYGLSALFMSYQSILLIAATWELFIGAYQRGIYKYENEIGAFTVSSLFFMNLVTLFCIALFLLFQGFFVGISRMPMEIWLVFFAYFFFFPAYNCWIVRKRKTYDYRPAVAATIAYSLISVVVPAIALVLIAPTAEVRIVFAFGPAAIYCALFYFASLRLGYIKDALGRIRPQWQYLARYQGPLILHSLAFYVLNQSDIVMISYLIGDAATAYYSVAYNIAMAINLLQNSINQSLTPWRYEMFEKGRFDRVKTSTMSLLVLIGVAIIAFILIAPDIVTLFFDPAYRGSVWCLPPIALSSYFIFLYSIFVNVETYYEKTQYVMYVSVACALLNIGLNFIGIHFLGYLGCAYATLASYIVFAFGHYWFMRLTLKKKDVSYRLIDSGRVFLLSSAFVAATALALVVYTVPWLRYAIFVLMLAVGLIKRKKIREILSGIKDIRQ